MDIEANNLETLKIVNEIFNKNKVDDLNNFVKKRSCLNTSNEILSILFYIFQSANVFITSIGNAYKNPYLIWSGVGMGTMASITYLLMNNNSKINKRLMNNIKAIKENKYTDEITDIFDSKSLKENNNTNTNNNNNNNNITIKKSISEI